MAENDITFNLSFDDVVGDYTNSTTFKMTPGKHVSLPKSDGSAAIIIINPIKPRY